MAFEVGAFVETNLACGADDPKWCIHEIIGVEDDFIIIKGNNGGWHLKIDTTSKRLAPLNTNTMNCILLGNVAMEKDMWYPLIYCKYLNAIVTLTTNGLEYYASSTNDWNCIPHALISTADFFYFRNQKARKVPAIDNTHHKIYVVRDDILSTGGNVKMLDLNSMKWNDFVIKETLINKEKIVKVIYINKLHAFTEKHQYQYDQESNRFEKVSDLPVVPIFDDHIIYSELLKKLILLGGVVTYERDIYYCDIDSNQTEFEWKKYNKFRMEICREVNILVCGHIVFALSSSGDTIDVMDFLFDIRFSFKPPKALSYLYQNKLPYYGSNDEYDSVNAAITNENYIHIVNSDQHFKFKLSDILSSDVRSFYTKQYELLIFGYIKDVQKANDVKYHFPFYLSKLVLSFYPKIC